MNALVLSKRARLYPKDKALGFSLGTLDKKGENISYSLPVISYMIVKVLTPLVTDC
jgi:hypothetical protein